MNWTEDKSSVNYAKTRAEKVKRHKQSEHILPKHQKLKREKNWVNLFCSGLRFLGQIVVRVMRLTDATEQNRHNACNSHTLLSSLRSNACSRITNNDSSLGQSAELVCRLKNYGTKLNILARITACLPVSCAASAARNVAYDIRTNNDVSSNGKFRMCVYLVIWW